MKVFIIIIIAVFSLNYRVSAINTILKVAFDPNLPPYQFLENDKPMGMHIDLLDKIAERYDFLIEYIPVEGTSKCMEALENGDVDIALGVINNNFKYKAEPSESISQSSIFMIVNNNRLMDIYNKNNNLVTVFENETISYSFAHNMENLRAIVVSDQVRAFNYLVSKRADALIGVKNCILYQLEKAGIEDDYTIVNNFMVPIEYSIAVKPGDKDLQKKINNGIQQLRISGEYQKIHDKWINEDKYVIRDIIRRILYIAALIAAAVAGIFIFNFRMNILLRKQVNEKTKELKKINNDLENQILETRNNNELKNRIVESSPSGIIVFDREWKITLFNQSVSRLINIYEPIIGKSVFEIELLNNILYDKKDILFLKDIRFSNEEITLKNGEDDSISYRYGIYQLFDLEDNVRGAILTIEDITEEKKIKEQIFEKEKNNALNQIIAGIAHEIRNPLTSIKTYIELIPVKISNLQFQNQLTEFVPKEVERVSDLIKNLIDYAKPENNYKEDIDLRDVVKSCTALIGHVMENERIALNIDIEAGLHIQADRNQMTQILINIILNGFESMKEKISNGYDADEKLNMYIKAWENEEYVFLQVIDEGIGMSETEIKKSTEPFFTTKSNGTGLGLYLSKQYVEKNDGIIMIDSEKHKYTKITLRFER
jgi:polar amino acid transport system substrate-binding protein